MLPSPGTSDSCSLALASLQRGRDMSSSHLNAQEQRVVQLFSEATQTVVAISTFSKKSILEPTANGREERTEDEAEVPNGTGSGFVYEKDDRYYILTSYHVICNSSSAQVVISNQSAYTAILKGYDGNNDVAVLEIDAPKEDMVPVKMGTSFHLIVGQFAYAIGNPFGLDHSLTRCAYSRCIAADHCSAAEIYVA